MEVRTRLAYMRPGYSNNVETHRENAVHCFFTMSVRVHFFGRHLNVVEA
jgi:hypothetical protein